MMESLEGFIIQYIPHGVRAFWYALSNGQILDEWIERINKWLFKLHLRSEKKYVQRDISLKINTASKQINKQADGIVTKGIELRFVDQDEVEAFLRQGKVIVTMRHAQNQDKNLAYAALHYTRAGVLGKGKIYLASEIQEAINLAVTKKILGTEGGWGTSTEYFITNILEPSLQNNSDLKSAFSTIEEMEKKGLFSRILLREIRLLGKKLSPAFPNSKHFKDTGDFFDFLELFAKREHGEMLEGKWEFIREDISAGILYVAASARLDKEGLKPYLKRIDKKIKIGTRNIYIFARGDSNVDAVEEITKRVKSKYKKRGIEVRVERYKSFGKDAMLRSICAIVSIKNT